MLSDDKKKNLLFPHEEVRKIQENLLLDIEKTIQEKKHLIANAPTGLGKTASALGPALSHALNNNLTVFFLTNRHTQHQLAVETLKLIQKKYPVTFNCADLLGKRWMCNQEVSNLFSNEFHEFCKSLTKKNECEFLNQVRPKNKLTVEAKRLLENLRLQGPLHNEELIQHCQPQNLCSYEISMELAKNSQIIIGDYYYLFNPFIQATLLQKLNLELEDIILIVDEAHNLPHRLVEMLSQRLTTNMLKNAILEAKKFGHSHLIPLLNLINSTLFDLNNFDQTQNQERLVTKAEFIQKLELAKPYEELTNELTITAEEIRKDQKKSFIGGVSSFLEAWPCEDQGFTRIIGQQSGKHGPFIRLSYDCLDPALVTKPLFEKVHSLVLMSGTLNPPFMYNDLLAAQALEKDYPNPFPPENKLTLIVPETTTKYSLRGPAMYQKIAQTCSRLLDNIPGNTAVFFPSYQLRDLISQSITASKKKFWEKPGLSKEEKEDFLEEFKQEKNKGGVLLGVMGGSFGEGIDLPGDLLQGVIIVGIPLGKPNLKTKETMRYFEEKFQKGWDYGYLYPALTKCWQSAGRCIRSETDKGAVIFLDERFAWQNYFCCFPKEGLIVTKEYEKHLQAFFGNQTAATSI